MVTVPTCHAQLHFAQVLHGELGSSSQRFRVAQLPHGDAVGHVQVDGQGGHEADRTTIGSVVLPICEYSNRGMRGLECNYVHVAERDLSVF